MSSGAGEGEGRGSGVMEASPLPSLGGTWDSDTGGGGGGGGTQLCTHFLLCKVGSSGPSSQSWQMENKMLPVPPFMSLGSSVAGNRAETHVDIFYSLIILTLISLVQHTPVGAPAYFLFMYRLPLECKRLEPGLSMLGPRVGSRTWHTAGPQCM